VRGLAGERGTALILFLVLGSVKSLFACIGFNRLYKAAAKVANVWLKKRKFAPHPHQEADFNQSLQ